MKNNTQAAASTNVKCTELMKEALSLYRQGLYDQAEQFAKLTHEEIKASSSFEYSYSMYKILGELYKTYLNDKTKVPHFKLLFRQLEVSNGYKPRDFAKELFKIGNCYRHDLDSADVFLQRALFYSEIAFGETHKEVATVLDAISEFYRLRGKYSMAVPYALRSLTIYENLYGPYHAEVKLALDRISNDYKAQGLENLAEPYSIRANEIWEHIKLSANCENTSKPYIAVQDMYFCSVVVDSFERLGVTHTNFDIALRHSGDRKRENQCLRYNKLICDYDSMDLIEKYYAEGAINELFFENEVKKLQEYFNKNTDCKFNYELAELPINDNRMALSWLPTGGGVYQFELSASKLMGFGVVGCYDIRHCNCPTCEEAMKKAHDEIQNSSQDEVDLTAFSE